MSATSAAPLVIVTDASLAVWTILPAVADRDVTDWFAGRRRGGVRFVAPVIWLAECVSAFRRYVHARVISIAEARDAIEGLFALEVETLPANARLCYSALDWAGRLQQARAYDGFYLALAEEMGAEFWTADERLANRAHQVGANWTHWIGEGQAATG